MSRYSARLILLLMFMFLCLAGIADAKSKALVAAEDAALEFNMAFWAGNVRKAAGYIHPDDLVRFKANILKKYDDARTEGKEGGVKLPFRNHPPFSEMVGLEPLELFVTLLERDQEAYKEYMHNVQHTFKVEKSEQVDKRTAKVTLRITHKQKDESRDQLLIYTVKPYKGKWLLLLN